MLGYLEQQPLYNASNFSWACAFGPGYPINRTVTVSILNVFLCPSDNLAPSAVPVGSHWSGRISDYYYSVGTTLAYQGARDTTGGFTMGGKSYGVQNIPDGTSSTIAFAEAVVGPDSGAYQTKNLQAIFRNGTNVAPGSSAGSTTLSDANMNYQAVLADMQTCQQAALSLPTSGPIQ